MPSKNLYNPSHVPVMTSGLCRRFQWKLVFFLLTTICCAGCLKTSEAKVLHVYPLGGVISLSDAKHSTPLRSIQQALELANPGDTIKLHDGEYFEDFHTVRSGGKDLPIVITGSPKAVVLGAGNARIVQIHHNYIVLDGFTINGKFRKGDAADSYRKKLIYVVSKTKDKGVSGLIIQNMNLKNAADECLRLRYLVTGSEIHHNHIKNCGILDFQFHGGGKNGEGIYLGTAPEQRNNGHSPDNQPDVSRANWIHHNVIETNGNECVDIKEAATENVVEYNTCIGQKDPKSGGLDARGSGNVFRYNLIKQCVGAGIRLGGDEDTDGIDNEVYGNRVEGCLGGGIKIERAPQRAVCGNTFTAIKPSRYAVGKKRATFSPSAACPPTLVTP